VFLTWRVFLGADAAEVSPYAACRCVIFFKVLIPAIAGRFISGDEAHGTRQRDGYPVTPEFSLSCPMHTRNKPDSVQKMPPPFVKQRHTARHGRRLSILKKLMKNNFLCEAATPANAVQQSSIRGEQVVMPFKFPATPHEFKITPLRECPTPDAMTVCGTPDRAADYWRMHIATNPYFNPECECLAVLMLNTRRKVKGHYIVATGTQDTILVHPREVFRLAVITAANALVVMHNHPSGESSPSEADIKVTRDLIRGGQLLKIEVIDHVIIGNGIRSSLRELGYFWA
jgi:DNA repair protein RadC